MSNVTKAFFVVNDYCTRARTIICAGGILDLHLGQISFVPEQPHILQI